MHVQFFDTTLRDGAQALPQGNQFPDGSKVAIADAIASVGVATIEAGFPATKGDAEEVRNVANTVGNRIYHITPQRIMDSELEQAEPIAHTPVITGLSRANQSDIETTWDAVKSARHPGIHTFVSTAASHIDAKHPGLGQDGVYEMAMQAIRFAREISTPETVIEFSCEAATGTDMKYLERVVRGAMQEGANVINLPDTLGQASERRINKIFIAATRWAIAEGVDQDIVLSAHNHNDSGRAVANTIAAMHAVEDTATAYGITPPVFQAEVTIGGLGERSGNTRIDATILALMLDADDGDFDSYPQTTVMTERIIPVTEFVFSQAGLVIPRQDPVVGKDSRTHRSGIHAHGVLAGGARIYSPYNPQWFGASETAIIDEGKYQGRHGRNHIGAVKTF